MIDYNKLNICQIMPTIQGEGDLTGVPSLLIRLSGCNLKCPMCDTKYSWTETIYSITNLENLKVLINNNIRNNKIKSLMITGGEPLLYAENPIFISALQYFLNENWTIEIETNGSLLYKEHKEFDRLLFSYKDQLILNISPKLNKNWYNNIDDYTNLISGLYFIRLLNVNIKIVDDPKLRNEHEEFIKNTKDYINKIRFMPLTPNRKKYKNHSDFLIDYNKASIETLKYCMLKNYIYTPRIHLYLFEDENEEIY